MNWSQAAVATAQHIVITIRCMAKDIRDGNWQQCFARAVDLDSEGISIGVINPATPKTELLAHLIGVRRQLRKKTARKATNANGGRESGTSSSKSPTQRKRAATKREVNAIIERPCRTILSAVTVGTR